MTWTAPEWTAPNATELVEPFVGDERETLQGFLDSYRITLLRTCSGLTGEQLALRSAPPSALSLLGLVRHLTDVERIWFRIRFGGEPVEPTYRRPDAPNAAFDEVDPAHAERDLRRLVAEMEAARRAAVGLPLDHVHTSPRWGVLSLRWAYCHVIGEYAQHNGHADIIRERIDGRRAR